jgi:hypothetical protein
MKELTRNDMAAIKRVYSCIKPLEKKRASLKKKLNDILEQIDEIDRRIDGWEAPVKEMTGGFTSDDILHGRHKEKESVDEPDVQEDELMIDL